MLSSARRGLSPPTRTAHRVIIATARRNSIMGKIESYAPGSFCWAELATSDAAAAKRFYSEMFGWTPVDVPTPQGAYTLLKSGGEDAAALSPAQPGVPVHWGVYFAVASADQTAAQVGPSGGKLITGPFDVMDVGRM